MDELEGSRARPEELAERPAAAAGGDPLVVGFDRVRRLFVPAGSTPFGEATTSEITRHESVDRLVTIGPPVCYAFIAFGTGEGLDIDLRVENPDGWPVAGDDAPDPFPVVPSYCPPESGTYAVRVTSARGSGTVRTGVFALPQSDASSAVRIAEVAGRYLVEPRSLGPVRTALLEESGEVSVPLALARGRCYGVVAVGGPAMADLDLELRDDHGVPLVRDLAIEAEPVIRQFCPPAGGAFRLRVDAYQGAGPVWWQLFEVAHGP